MKKLLKLISAITVLLLNAWAVPLFAASLTLVSDTLSRLEEATASDHTVKFTTPTGAGDAGDTITITFPTEFTVGTVTYDDIDLSHGASTGYETEEVLAAVAGASAWGASFVGQVLTLTHPTDGNNGDIAAAQKVVIEIGDNATGGAGNDQITNPATNGTYIVSLAGTFGDTGKFALAILDSASDDTVSLDATVDPSITFSLSAHTSTFGVLSPGVVDTADTNVVLTVGTNAVSGYVINVRDTGSGTNPGLYSAGTSEIIDSATGDLDVLSSGYGIQASCTAGCTTATHILGKWRGAVNNIGGLNVIPEQLVSYSSALSADHTIQVVHKAKSSATTKAGTYTDTVYYIATGVF